MNGPADPTDADPSGMPPPHAPSEEELRAAYEEQLAKVSSAEMALQAAVSLLALGGRRLGLAPGEESQRDLEQVRDAIDGVRGLIPVLERRMPREIAPLRDALSQLQLAYAREAQAGAAEGPSAEREREVERTAAAPSGDEAGARGEDEAPRQERGEETPPRKGGDREPGQDESAHRPGPAESSGRLWVPGR
jgi:hypothetical protein